MNKQYLNDNRYDWLGDPKHLKIDGMMPPGRCLICGRIFLNAANAIVFCKMCDCAMSICRDGAEHDYDTFGVKIKVKDKDTNQIKTINLMTQREIRSPIEFSEEGKYFDKNNKSKAEPHFITAAGKIIDVDSDAEEAERVKRLYDLRKYE